MLTYWAFPINICLHFCRFMPVNIVFTKSKKHNSMIQQIYIGSKRNMKYFYLKKNDMRHSKSSGGAFFTALLVIGFNFWEMDALVRIKANQTFRWHRLKLRNSKALYMSTKALKVVRVNKSKNLKNLLIAIYIFNSLLSKIFSHLLSSLPMHSSFPFCFVTVFRLVFDQPFSHVLMLEFIPLIFDHR